MPACSACLLPPGGPPATTKCHTLIFLFSWRCLPSAWVQNSQVEHGKTLGWVVSYSGWEAPCSLYCSCCLPRLESLGGNRGYCNLPWNRGRVLLGWTDCNGRWGGYTWEAGGACSFLSGSGTLPPIPASVPTTLTPAITTLPVMG